MRWRPYAERNTHEGQREDCRWGQGGVAAALEPPGAGREAQTDPAEPPEKPASATAPDGGRMNPDLLEPPGPAVLPPQPQDTDGRGGRDDGCSCVPTATGETGEVMRLTQTASAGRSGRRAGQAAGQRVASPDSQKRRKRGLRLGPGVQSEVRDLGFWRHTKGWDTGRLREAKPSRVSRMMGPHPCQNRDRFPMCLCTGLTNCGGTGVRRRKVLSVGKEAMGRFPGHVPV